jgi:hypothetical protein
MVAAKPHVRSRMETGAALAHQDISRQNLLAAETLDAKSLGLGIAAVSRAAACFFMCHF